MFFISVVHVHPDQFDKPNEHFSTFTRHEVFQNAFVRRFWCFFFSFFLAYASLNAINFSISWKFTLFCYGRNLFSLLFRQCRRHLRINVNLLFAFQTSYFYGLLYSKFLGGAVVCKSNQSITLTFISFSFCRAFVCQMVFCFFVIAFAKQNNRQQIIFTKFYVKTKRKRKQNVYVYNVYKRARRQNSDSYITCMKKKKN